MGEKGVSKITTEMVRELMLQEKSKAPRLGTCTQPADYFLQFPGKAGLVDKNPVSPVARAGFRQGARACSPGGGAGGDGYDRPDGPRSWWRSLPYASSLAIRPETVARLGWEHVEGTEFSSRWS
jgi:hypothetical protein